MVRTERDLPAIRGVCFVYILCNFLGLEAHSSFHHTICSPSCFFLAASACLCGCFFAFVSPGDGCAYVGGYQPTAVLHLSEELDPV